MLHGDVHVGRALISSSIEHLSYCEHGSRAQRPLLFGLEARSFDFLNLFRLVCLVGLSCYFPFRSVSLDVVLLNQRETGG